MNYRFGLVWLYENGRIKRSSACMDVIPVMQQLGLPVHRDFAIRA